VLGFWFDGALGSIFALSQPLRLLPQTSGLFSGREVVSGREVAAGCAAAACVKCKSVSDAQLGACLRLRGGTVTASPDATESDLDW